MTVVQKKVSCLIHHQSLFETSFLVYFVSETLSALKLTLEFHFYISKHKDFSKACVLKFQELLYLIIISGLIFFIFIFTYTYQSSQLFNGDQKYPNEMVYVRDLSPIDCHILFKRKSTGIQSTLLTTGNSILVIFRTNGTDDFIDNKYKWCIAMLKLRWLRPPAP